MKNIQISEELFFALLKYHLVEIDDVLPEIKKGLEDKLEAMVRRDLYTTLFRETYHSVTSRFFSNNTCWKLIFAIHFISPTRLNKILFFYCIIMHYPV